MGEHVKPLGKAFLIDGESEPRHKKYLVGNKQIRFTLNKDNGKWIVSVKDGARHAEWESILIPGNESARIIGEVAPRAFLAQSEEVIFVLSRIAKLNKKFPRATFDRIFRGRDGWTETRKKRLIRHYRDMGYIRRKGKMKYILTYDGSLELLERKEYVNEIRPARRSMEELAPKRGRKKEEGRGLTMELEINQDELEKFLDDAQRLKDNGERIIGAKLDDEGYTLMTSTGSDFENSWGDD